MSLREFQSVLRTDEAFIDIYRFWLYEKGKPVGNRYAAVVTGRKFGPTFVDLGDAEKVNSAITAWRSAVLSNDPSNPAWHTLFQLVWRDIVTNLPPVTRKVFVSPDSELARIPWNLFPSGPTSSNKLLVAHVDSARELLRLRNTQVNTTQQRTILLAGDINFNAGAGSISTERFLPLPGSAAELERLGAFAKSNGIESTLLTRDEVTKERVRNLLTKVSFAHLATHGFFDRPAGVEVWAKSPDAGRRPVFAQPATTPRNPLVESGIALAGANVPDPSTMEATGLFTAEEIVGLDLSNCSLVTLSACDTGRGEEVTGQGVMGLRATIIAAGARNMLMSLWKVDDEATARLMEAFYRNLWVKKLSRAEALMRAQETVRDDLSGNYRKPVYWAAWVLAGEGW
jgi:CHAT domain-containing protein